MTALHRPSDPGKSQDMQALVHAALQHTPWAQKLDLHSVPALHSAPLGLRPQEELTQKVPGTHWLLLLVQIL